MTNEFMAFAASDTAAEPVRIWVQHQGLPSEGVRAGGAEAFAKYLEANTPPKIALVDFDGQEEPERMAARLAGACGKECKLIAMGSVNDVSLFRAMIMAGVTDYLLKPLTADILTSAVQAASREGAGPGNKEARNIVFIGVRGGVGASTLAVNTAWILAHEMKKKTVLLDLDLQYGTSALALDVEPGHGLRDVLSSPQRVDSLMIAGAAVIEDANLSVLSAEETVEEPVLADGAAVAALLKELRTAQQAVIVDLPRHLIAAQKRLLAAAHEIVLVTDLSLAGIRDCLRLRTMLKGLGASARVTLASAPAGPARPAAVDEATFAKGAGAKIDFIIPEDGKNVAAASNAGKMLAAVASGAALTKTVRALTAHLIGAGGETASKTSGGLLGLFKFHGKEGA